MSIDAEFQFHEVVDSFARLDSLALRIQREAVEVAGGDGDVEPTRIDGLTVYVTLNDEGAAKRLALRHRLVPGPPSPLELSRTWCGWLPEASRLLPVSVQLTLVSDG
ncbi:hypothetical protein [Myceligenerans pegani]|uniref:Uncharacterized protein n=1 Tax=Myceligenerans pegani TaxID=2776917 RepID=A0ABR9MSF6_9MICO|nr:hypothetical protein [Myceligenerans sp. TRM 65318]MBE1874317.1 hypothetical protein [Myceligenerans sp. TRM 65318]MBE3016588.1 hypothetical protein [Myceligenerans sp. TRM 65318]